MILSGRTERAEVDLSYLRVKTRHDQGIQYHVRESSILQLLRPNAAFTIKLMTKHQLIIKNLLLIQHFSLERDDSAEILPNLFKRTKSHQIYLPSHHRP